MRLLPLMTVSLSVLTAFPLQAANYCTSQDHVAKAIPLAQQFISTPDQIRRSIDQQAAQNPDVASQKEVMIQRLSAMVSSKPYKKGMINIICKNFSLDELQGKDTSQQSVIDGLLQPKLQSIQQDIGALSQSLAQQQ